MSATELIQQVAALPREERALFEQLFQEMQNSSHVPAPASEAKWPDFGERLRARFGDRILPDSQSIIDEGRGDR